MTVSSTSSRIDYLGTATVGPFSFPFRIQVATDLTLTKTTDTGIESTLTYLTDYTVAGIGVRSGGSVTLTAVLPVGYSLTIRRVLPLTQLTNLRNQGRYLPSEVEDTFDRGTMTDQQLSEVDARQISLPISSDPAVVSALFPTPQANRAIFWNSTETALEARLLDDSNNVALPGNSRTITTLTEYLANNAVFNVKDYGAIGNGIHDDTTNIQNCLNAAPAGAIIRIPTGIYLISGLVDQCLLVDKPLTILGDGWDAILRVSAATPATVDAIRLLGGYGGGFMTGNYIGHLKIEAASGNPGRSCINVDVTPGTIAYALFEYLDLGILSSYSFACTNPVPRTDGFFTTTIQDCKIGGGVNLENGGDSLHMYRNTVYSISGNANQLGIRINLLAGPALGTVQGFELVGNNITCAGGIDYLCGNAGVISHNNMENPYPTTNSGNAMVNVEGTVANPVMGLTIRDNLFGAGNNSDYVIRINYARGTLCSHNLTGPPPPPKLSYYMTAEAIGTLIEDETWGLSSTLPEAAVLDLGRGTVIRVSTAMATHTYNQSAYYLALKAALSNTQVFEFGTDQYADSIVVGVAHNDPVAPLGALINSPGNLSVGAVRYRVAYVRPSGEQAAGTISSLTYITTPGTIGQVALTGIAVDTALVDTATARKIYRTVANGADFFLLATIADNVTTTYTDNTADASLGAAMTRGKPTAGETFGDLFTKGVLRVFGAGTVRVGDGADMGSKFQVGGNSYFDGGITTTGRLSLAALQYIAGHDTAGTEFAIFSFNRYGDNLTRVGSEGAPATAGDTLLLGAGVEKARTNAAGFKVLTGFGCNGTTPQTAASIGAALAAYGAGANGLSSGAEMQALVNQVKAIAAALKANGIAIV